MRNLEERFQAVLVEESYNEELVYVETGMNEAVDELQYQEYTPEEEEEMDLHFIWK